MGAVFRALDRELEREVAIKIAWPMILMDGEASGRFVNEAKTVAALKHPGIVKVYDAGDIDVIRFISFELIEGPTLAQWMKEQDQIPIRLTAEIVHSIANAVAFAHERGIVHRDLKPSNVLLRPRNADGKRSPFEPVVTDFAQFSVLGYRMFRHRMSPEH
ncbi:MAG: serine/threonine-protein kinase [Planctomycetota bacterium]